MANIAKVGLDMSINSTGLTFIFGDIVKFYQIVPAQSPHSASISQVVYKRDWRKDNYSYEDLAKIISATRLSLKINDILKRLKDTYSIDSFDVRIEGSIMSQGFKKQQSRVNDLTVFNSNVKLMLINNKTVSRICVVSPTSLKKWATGKGNSKKDAIVLKFVEQFPEFDKIGKIDDIADSYFLAKQDVLDEHCFVKQDIV
jgi:Holliday junction resolvasome RuvABC endonuclease subunit